MNKKELEVYVDAIERTVSRNDSATYRQLDNLSIRINKLKSELDGEHNRISVLAPKVDMLVVENMSLQQDISYTKDLAVRLLGILQRSGILEEAVDGNDLFQMHSTVDTLRRYPLYKINKVVTRV